MSTNVQVLWIVVSQRWSGAEQVALSDIVELADENIPTSLLCIKGSPIHAAAIRHKNIQVYPVDTPPKFFWDWGFVREVRVVIQKVGPNVVHINDDKILFYLLPAIRGIRQLSIVLSRHRMAQGGIKDFLKAPLFRRVDFISVLSDIVKHSVVRGLPVSPRKVKVVNLGLDFTKFDPESVNSGELRKLWGADKDTIVIGSVGHLRARYGHETFLKAAAGLMKHPDKKLKFVIIGEETLDNAEKYLVKLKKLVQIFGLENFVTFSALQDNLPEVLAAFDIYVMSGKEDVPGLGALHALAMQTPVVLSRIAGAEEVVGYEKFGLLVRPNDAFDLQQKMMQLLNEHSTRLTMGKDARKYILKNFDKKSRFLNTLEIYKKAIQKRSRVRLRLGSINRKKKP